MPAPASEPVRSSERQEWFATTHWSVVLAAGHDSAPGARQAMAQVCGAYWYSLYCFVRRQGFNPSDAEDLTQGFLAHLLERKALERVAREKGRFRSFLLASLKYFLADERDKAQAQKRGGGCGVVSLDEEGAEERYQREFSDDLTPEKLYERRWAMTVLERAFVRLRAEFARAGNLELYEELRRLQDDGSDAAPYAEVAARLAIPVNTLKSHVHRFRRRYRELLCHEIADTVASPADIEVEIRYLKAALRGNRIGIRDDWSERRHQDVWTDDQNAAERATGASRRLRITDHESLFLQFVCNLLVAVPV